MKLVFTRTNVDSLVNGDLVSLFYLHPQFNFPQRVGEFDRAGPNYIVVWDYTAGGYRSFTKVFIRDLGKITEIETEEVKAGAGVLSRWVEYVRRFVAGA